LWPSRFADTGTRPLVSKLGTASRMQRADTRVRPYTKTKAIPVGADPRVGPTRDLRPNFEKVKKRFAHVILHGSCSMVLLIWTVMGRTPSRLVSVGKPPLYSFLFLSSSEFVTTLTLDNAMAVPAIMGFNRPKAASGMPTIL
jgi:hypothetical protein